MLVQRPGSAGREADQPERARSGAERSDVACTAFVRPRSLWISSNPIRRDDTRARLALFQYPVSLPLGGGLLLHLSVHNCHL